MKSELQRDLAGMMEKFDLVMAKWGEQEKGSSSESAAATLSSETPNKSHELGGIHGDRTRHGENAWVDNRIHRLEMPVFNGEAPDAWIFRAERYFGINQLTNLEKIEAAAVCFEGEALAWFQGENGRQPLLRWDDLKILMLQRFRPSQEGSVLEKLLALKQDGSVRDYRRWFELLAAPLPDIPDSVLEGNFINGLDPIIRAEVRMIRPQGLGQIMELAQRVEDRNDSLKRAVIVGGPLRYKANNSTLPSPVGSGPNYMGLYPKATNQIPQTVQ